MPRLGSGIPLVARDREMRALRAAFDRAAAGEPGAVLVSGDAGVGKTRVLTELADTARAAGALVLTGRCLDVIDGGLPYLPFADAVGGLLSAGDEVAAAVVRERPALNRLLPQRTVEPRPFEVGEMPSPDVESSRRARGQHDIGQLQLFDAVLGLLGALADRGPVVLLLEDLHWADASTRYLLSFLASRLRDQRLLLVGSYREEDVHRKHPLRGLLAELVRLSTVERVELAPFGRADTLAFVTALAEDTLDADTALTVAERSEGNPFFAEELLASDACSADLPSGLAELLLARVERLPAATQRVLRTVAVADGGVAHTALAEVTGIEVAELEEALREAIAHHVLVVDRDYYTFRHALLREAVYVDLLPGERSRIHAAYAARLRGRELMKGGAARLAFHSLESNDLPTALTASITAADDAERSGAPGVALRHIEQALRLWDAVPEAQRPAGSHELILLDEASYFSGTSGEPERALAYSRSAVERIDDTVTEDQAARLWRRLAQALLSVDLQEDEAVAAIGRAWELVADRPAKSSRAWILATLATVQRLTGDLDAARQSALRAVSDAHAVDAGGAEADALITLGRLAARSGDDAEAVARTREAVAKATEAGTLTVELRAWHCLGLLAEDRADLTTALREYRAGTARAEENGLVWGGFGLELRARELYLRFVTGDWPSEVDAARADRRVPVAVAARMAAAGVYLAAARGHFEIADRLVAEMRSAWRTDMLVALSAGAAGAEVAYWRGDHDESIALVRQTIGRLAEFEPWLLGGIRLGAIGVLAAAAAAAIARRHGDPAREEKAVAAGEEFLRHARSCAENGVPQGDRIEQEGRAWASRAEAAASGLRGPDSAALWAGAVEAFGYGAVYDQAVCRLHHAAALLAAPESGASTTAAGEWTAVGELTAAFEVADRLDATPLRDAVRELARRAKLTLPGQRPPRETGDPLTGRERAVLELVALGRTNRQVGAELFISEKTVSVHLSRVMGKLGARRRAEAVAIGYDRGLLESPPT